MKRFVEGEDRRQGALLPHCLDDYVTENNPVRVIEAFIDELDLATLGFDGVVPETTGRPAYHPATLLKIYLYGYLNRVQSSRRLEREAQRNIELMWLTGRLAPDFKTIADFRKDNGAAIRAVCSQFVVLCRQLGLFTRAVVAIDGSKFKAVNNRDKNYTVAKVIGRMEQVDASIARYLRALDRVDREESDVAEAKSVRLKEKIAGTLQIRVFSSFTVSFSLPMISRRWCSAFSPHRRRAGGRQDRRVIFETPSHWVPRQTAHRSATVEPMVCRLSAGGKWIRTSGSARDKASVPRYRFGPPSVISTDGSRR